MNPEPESTSPASKASRNNGSARPRGPLERESPASEGPSAPPDEHARALSEIIQARRSTDVRAEAAPGPSRRKPSAVLCFADAVDRLVGKQVIVADPEALEETLVGHQIVKSIHQATVSHRAGDCIALAQPFVHRHGEIKGKETVEQLIPLSKIKRMTIMKGQIVLHL